MPVAPPQSPPAAFRRLALLARPLVAPLLDGLAAAAGLALAVVVAFDFGRDPQALLYLRQAAALAAPLALLRVGAVALSGGYRGVTRFFGFADAARVVLAALLGSLVFLAAGVSLPSWGEAAARLGAPTDAGGRPYRVPFRVHGVEGLIALVGLVGWRALGRGVAGVRADGAVEGDRVLIVGAGAEGRALARQLAEERPAGARAVAFVEAAPDLAGRRLLGLPVVDPGETAGFAARLAALAPTRVVVAGDDVPAATVRALLAALHDRRASWLRLPSLARRMGSGAATLPPVGALPPLRPDDLLRRDPVALEPTAATRAMIAGACAVVTGAGGSIGSELCRRLLRLGAARVVAVGRGENSLHALRLELEEEEGAMRLEPVVADVRDETAMGLLLRAARPSLVLHAAAHKHVVLMERHPVEAWRNNAAATRALARLAREAEVARFVLVSTDKAVRPSSVMGATKRLAEWAVAAESRAATESGRPLRAAAVRFGNVLGSRGSVVPVLLRAIARGGPLRLSHPDAVRFFMTLEEAAALVVEAATLGDAGALYLLEMGEPLRIVDLARALVTLSGRADDELAIEFTGLQAGEKLREEVVTASCPAEPTGRGGVLRAAIDAPDEAAFAAIWEPMERAAAVGDDATMRRLLFAAIPDAGPATAPVP